MLLADNTRDAPEFGNTQSRESVGSHRLKGSGIGNTPALQKSLNAKSSA
jgi:hypothetical protein